uniref:Uncharacterized protein n=1 Tax=Hanusia phi TaxID=3032 RepID=A0A7S0EQK1_9CRYP
MAAVNKCARLVDLEDCKSKLKRQLQAKLDFEWLPESNEIKPSSIFADANPINRLKAFFQVTTNGSANEEGPFCCMIEACSGSGKSLCAAEFYVRNPTQSLYFLFGHSFGATPQDLYQAVQPITDLLNLAFDFDLHRLGLKDINPSAAKRILDALSVNMQNDFRWHFLGALGYLCKQTNTVAPVSVREAQDWKERPLLLIDEAVPSESKNLYILSPIARVILLRRLLRNAKINCVLLGTNTLVMNFSEHSAKADASREKGCQLGCITHRALPPYILPSSKYKDCLERIFGDEQTKILLDNVNPWLFCLFLKNLMQLYDTNQDSNAAFLIRKATQNVLTIIKGNKKSLRHESIYCMFQISAHQSACQYQISKGFAQLNLWKVQPDRTSRKSILRIIETDSSPLTMNNIILHDLTSRFVCATQDPISVALCAGEGRPFGDDCSALALLQRIHAVQAAGTDPIVVDAFKRDGNLLESFGAVVLMLCSWSDPPELLRNLAFHCGKTDDRELDLILAGVQAKESFIEILTSCLRNLVPVKNVEKVRPAGFGFYSRCADQQKRDGTFSGPEMGRAKPFRGGAEFKHRIRRELSASTSIIIINDLLQHDLDVSIYMASWIPVSDMKSITKQDLDSEWLILSLKKDSHLWEVHVREPSGAATHRGEKVVDSTGRVEVNNRSERASTGNKRKGDDSDDSETKRPRTTRRRILILVELGEQTLPFCGPALQT